MVNFKNAKLTCSLAQATDKTVAAESRAVQSEERLAVVGVRFHELTKSASKATAALARKTAEVQSLTRDLTEAREAAAAEAGGRVSVHEVRVGDACGSVSALNKKTEYLREDLGKALQIDEESSRWVVSCVSR